MGEYSTAISIVCAFIFTCAACGIASWHIYLHLVNYTEPTFQRFIVRITCMVPVYATMSFCALVFSEHAIYFNTIRDIYEAWVIYNFLSLCLAWVGGPGAVVTNLSGQSLKPSYLLMTCCFPAIPLDGRFIRRCKQGCLQFVIVKPVLAGVSLLLYNLDLYEDGNFSPKKGYLYLTPVYMTSYSLAVYSLVLFGVSCKDLLKPFDPLPKFLVIKSVVFLTYWQGIFVFLLSVTNAIKDEENAADLQNLLICIEMALAALGFMIAFPHRPYMLANVGETVPLASSISHAISFNDVVSDTVHQFAPTYHDYVLYSDGSQENAKRFRTRTFVLTGQEMENVRKNRHPNRYPSDDLLTPTTPSTFSPSHKIPPPSNPTVPSPSQTKTTKEKSPIKPLTEPFAEPSLFPNQPYDSLAIQRSRTEPILHRDLIDLDGRKSSSGDESKRVSHGGGESSRTSASSDVREDSHLTKTHRKSSHGLLLDEVDINGEDYCNVEGHIRR